MIIIVIYIAKCRYILQIKKKIDSAKEKKGTKVYYTWSVDTFVLLKLTLWNMNHQTSEYIKNNTIYYYYYYCHNNIYITTRVVRLYTYGYPTILCLYIRWRLTGKQYQSLSVYYYTDRFTKIQNKLNNIFYFNNEIIIIFKYHIFKFIEIVCTIIKTYPVEIQTSVFKWELPFFYYKLFTE